MSIPARLEKLIKAEKQRHFPKGLWSVGKIMRPGKMPRPASQVPHSQAFAITEEDILDYNKACGETDRSWSIRRIAQKLPTGSCCSILCS
jgi:hypothetical protein